MAMLRSKHVLPLYNGARAVFFAGSNHTNRNYPPDSSSPIVPHGIASSIDDSNIEQQQQQQHQQLQHSTSSSSLSTSSREATTLSRTIESVIGPKIKSSHANHQERGIIPSSIVKSNAERSLSPSIPSTSTVSSSSSSPSSPNNANFPSVSEQIFKQGTFFHGNATGMFPLSSLNKDSSTMTAFPSLFSPHPSPLTVSNTFSTSSSSPSPSPSPSSSLVSPESFLQSKKVSFNLPSLPPSSTREFMHPVANSYKQDLDSWKENSNLNSQNSFVVSNQYSNLNYRPIKEGESSKSIINSEHSSPASNNVMNHVSTSDVVDVSHPKGKPDSLSDLSKNHSSESSNDIHYPHVRDSNMQVAQASPHSNTTVERVQNQSQSQNQNQVLNFDQEYSRPLNHQSNPYIPLYPSPPPHSPLLPLPHDPSSSTHSINFLPPNAYQNQSSFHSNQVKSSQVFPYDGHMQSGENNNQGEYMYYYREMDNYGDDVSIMMNANLNSKMMQLLPHLEHSFHSQNRMEYNEFSSSLSSSPSSSFNLQPYQPPLPFPLPLPQNSSSRDDSKSRTNKHKSHYHHQNPSPAFHPPSSSSPSPFPPHSSSLSSKNIRRNKSQSQNETVKAVCKVLDQIRVRSSTHKIRQTSDAVNRSLSLEPRPGPNLNPNLASVHEPVHPAIDAVSYRAELDAALSKWHGTLNVYNACDVLKQQEDAELALAFFEWTKRQPRYKADVFVYTTLIGILGKERRCKEVEGLLQEMKREGCIPTVVTYNRLIHSYGRGNMLTEAISSFNRMIASGLKPDFVTYSSLIDIYSKAGLHQKALQTYDEMMMKGIKPDVVVYTMILNSYGKMGNLKKALSTFREIENIGYRPNLVAYNTIIDLFGKSGDADKAMTLFRELKAVGLNPDLLTYSTVVDMCGKNGRLDEAEDLFNEMLTSGLHGDSIAWSSLVQMWGRYGQTDKAVVWFGKMIEAGCNPTVPAFNSLLCTFVKAKLFSEAKKVLSVMRERGMNASLMTYTLLLSSVSDCEGEEMKLILDLMKSVRHPVHGLLQSLLLGKGKEKKAGGEGEGRGEENEIECIERNMITEMALNFDRKSNSLLSSLPLFSLPHSDGFLSSEPEDEVWKNVKLHLCGIRTEDLEIKRAYSDAVINFLYKFGKHNTAGRLWKETFNQNFWVLAKEGKKSDTFTLNLHSMSTGTAITVIKFELLSLRGLAMEEEERKGGSFPALVEIITGWGKRSKVVGSSVMKQEVEKFFNDLNSPFLYCVNNAGMMYANGGLVQTWLKLPRVAESLMLRDENGDGL